MTDWSKCDLILHRNSIARALTDARNVVYGDEKAQYALLRDYNETLLKTNPGNTLKIGVTPLPDEKVMFQKMYICLSGCKNEFKAGCRPLIGLDGAFLKTHIGGRILSAVAQDGNHHIYVIAWAIVNVENKENWKWFLELLHDDLGDYKVNGWWKDLELRRLLWDAARSTTFQDFMDNMDKIKRVSGDAWTCLNKWLRHSWTKSQFSHRPKLDNICNNACEVFNAWIKEAKSKPIITLLEEVRMFVMRLIAKNKVKLNKHVGKLPPVIQSRLEKGHTKRECKKKRTDEVAATLVAATAAIAAAKSKITPTVSTLAVEASNTTNEAPQVVEAPPGVGIQNLPHVDVTNNFPPPVATAEIDLSQPNYNGT
ncbi:uncharacterized protein [Arachis hypogaea]|uniref:uncharacterized protein n=1 Tax=Arachis hypogaea TaxID=3818 RepID=UPI003B222242